MKTYIVLRQSPDWENISINKFREQSRRFCELIGRPTEQINMYVDLWNKTFKISFFETRQKIKEITIENLHSIENVEIVNNIDELIPSDIKEGYYIFIDDDDWLHPQIADLLSEIDNKNMGNGIVWGSVAFGTLNKNIIIRRKLDGYCYTNNYAIIGNFLKFYLLNNDNKIFQHGKAHNILVKNGRLIINEYWSITNKNPSSTVYMEQLLKGNLSSELFTEGIINYLSRFKQIDSEIDISLIWAKTMMMKMEQIFLDLL